MKVATIIIIMTRAKKSAKETKKASVKSVKEIAATSASTATKSEGKVVWVTDDNCCLLYAMWETLTKKQQDLLTVSDNQALHCFVADRLTEIFDYLKYLSDGWHAKHHQRNEKVNEFGRKSRVHKRHQQ